MPYHFAHAWYIGSLNICKMDGWMDEQIISYRTSTRAKKGTWRKDSMLEAKRGENFSKSRRSLLIAQNITCSK